MNRCFAHRGFFNERSCRTLFVDSEIPTRNTGTAQTKAVTVSGWLALEPVLLLSLTGLDVVMPFTTKQATNNLPARHNTEENFSHHHDVL